MHSLSAENAYTQSQRSPRKSGIQFGAQAFCKVCNWLGVSHFGKGAARNAGIELAIHRAKEKCK